MNVSNAKLTTRPFTYIIKSISRVMTIIIYDNPISYETFGQTFSLFVVYARLEHTNSLERASNCDELSILYASLYLIANLVQFDE